MALKGIESNRNFFSVQFKGEIKREREKTMRFFNTIYTERPQISWKQLIINYFL